MVIDVHAHYIPTGVFENDFFNIKKERETETMYVNKKHGAGFCRTDGS